MDDPTEFLLRLQQNVDKAQAATQAACRSIQSGQENAAKLHGQAGALLTRIESLARAMETALPPPPSAPPSWWRRREGQASLAVALMAIGMVTGSTVTLARLAAHTRLPASALWSAVFGI